MTTTSTLKALERLVGTWTTEATHPAMPDTVVRGTVTVEWLEGQRFLIHRSRFDHPEFPAAIAIIGFTERDRVDPPPAAETPPQSTMHYFDSRGVFRVYESHVEDDSWKLSRMAAGFSQRFDGTFVDGGDTIAGSWQVCEDGEHWNDDLRITYRRRKNSGRTA